MIIILKNSPSKCEKYYLPVPLMFQTWHVRLLDQYGGRREVLNKSEMWSAYGSHIGKKGKIDLKN